MTRCVLTAMLFVLLASCASRAPSIPVTPAADVHDDKLCFFTTSTDPQGRKVQYVFAWGDGDTTTTALVPSGDTAWCDHAFADTGAFHVKAMARNEDGRGSGWSAACAFSATRVPQAIDTLTGLRRWATDRWYRCSLKVSDPDGDSVAARFIFGDSVVHAWTAFVPSGGVVCDSVKWPTVGGRTIRVVLKDQGSMVNTSAASASVNVNAVGVLWCSESNDWGLWEISPVLGDIDGEVVLFTFIDDYLACIGSDGRMRWSSPTRVAEPLFAPSLSADGSHLYYTDDNFGLFCLDARTGAQVWNIDTLYGHDCTVVVGPGNSVYFSSGGFDNRVVRVRDMGATATVEWTTPLCRWGLAQIALAQNGTVYAVTNQMDTVPGVRVWALDSGGALLWQDSTHLRWAEYTIGLAVDSRGRLIVGDECDSLFCFNPDGTLAWRQFIQYLYPGGTSVGYGDRVYVHDNGYRFYCLNSDGTIEWTVDNDEAGGALNSVCVLADSSILAYDGYDCLLNIDYRGQVRWTYYLEDSLWSAPRRRAGRDDGDDCATPAVGPDGNVYLCGGDLWSFACGNARLANTAWPTYNHDNARSGWAGRPW